MKFVPLCASFSVLGTVVGEPIRLEDYVAHPLVALCVAVAMAWVGVTANWMLSGKKVELLLMVGRLLAAFILTFVFYAIAESQNVGPVWAVALAGLGGLFFDVTFALVEKRWTSKLDKEV